MVRLVGGMQDGLEMLVGNAVLQPLRDGRAEHLTIEIDRYAYVAHRSEPTVFRLHLVRDQPLTFIGNIPEMPQPPPFWWRESGCW